MDFGVINETDGNKIVAAVTFIGSFNRDNTVANGTQAVVGVGFKPSYIFFFSATSPTSVSGTFGFANITTGRALFSNHVNSADTFNLDDDSPLRTVNVAATTNEGDLTSLDADGFTITWAKVGAPTGTTLCRFMAVK